MTNLDTFLSPVYKAMAEFLELKDSQGTLAIADIVLKHSAKIAFYLIQKYVNRPILLQESDEVYFDVSDDIHLRNVPLADTDARVWLYESDEEITDFVVKPTGIIHFTYYNSQSFIQGDNYLSDNLANYRVVYTGGYREPKDELLQALVIQGVSIYRDRDTLGLGYPSGDQKSFNVVQNNIGVSLMVKELLYSYRYYGTVVNYVDI
jgi:hypothetical protein